MEPIPADAERSIRRSRVRARVLVMLCSMGEGYVASIARAAGVEWRRCAGALTGRMPDYRPELGLVALGLVEERRTANGRLYRPTRRGLRKARSLAKRWARRREERIV